MLKQHKIELLDYVRTTSVGCTHQPRENAFMYLQSGDLRAFVDIINNPDVEAGAGSEEHWINQPVEDEADQSSLLDAAVRARKEEFVAALVKVGVMRDLVNTTSGLSPLHLACQLGDPHLLRLLLGDDEAADPNVRSSDRKGGFAPLHVASQTQGSGQLACLELLVKRDDVNVDIRDVSSVQTPLFLAVQAKNESAVKTLIAYGANPDLQCGRKTVREYMKEDLPHFDPRAVRVIKTRDLMDNLEDKLLTIVRETDRRSVNAKADLANFRTYVRFIRSVIENDQLDEVFNLACEKGLHEHAALLLKKGVDPNNKENPILEVAYKGYSQVMRVLLQDPRTNIQVMKPLNRETILHLILKMDFEQTSASDYEECLAVVFRHAKQDQLKLIVNKKDGLGSTALHYATQKWNDGVVRNLLEMGANIGIKNYWSEVPVAKIRPQTMEDFLDEHCLLHDGDIMHEDFEISFRYNFLAPDPEALPEKYRAEEEEEQALTKSHQHQEALPETDCLWYLGQSKEHRHLLKHPVITSFLWYKWQRIRKYFNRNLRLYIVFVFLLSWFIFKEFGSHSAAKLSNNIFYFSFIIMTTIMISLIVRDWVLDIQESRNMWRLKQTRPDSVGMTAVKMILSNWPEAALVTFLVVIILFGSSILQYGLTGLLIVLLMIEIFQLMVSLKRYFFQLENWIELLTIALVFTIIYNDRRAFELNRNLAAIAILLSWSRMITLIGRHPKNNRLNIYVTMFFKVLKSFFSFLSWYGLFLVAFGLSFFIMLHQDVAAVGQAGTEEEYPYFNYTFLSVVKTMTMFVGELEFSDIPISLESSFMPLNYLFFLTFVFLIVVVLMNLLNGLAVSDTGAIQEQAEIFSYLSRVETISYLESVLLGDPFDFLSNVPRYLSAVPSCSVFRQLYRSNTLRKVFTKLGASNILLFYNYLPEKRSPVIRPNNKLRDCGCLR